MKFALLGYLVLTVVIIVFPTKFSPLYNPIQSTSIFSNLFYIFIVLLLLWVSFAYIVCIRYTIANKWIPFFVIALFPLGFIGFWVIRTSIPFPFIDGSINYDYIQSILSFGHIGPSIYNDPFFFTWPGYQVFAVFLKDVLGLNTDLGMVASILVMIVVGPLLFYQLCNTINPSRRLSTFATMLFVGGSTFSAANNFTPGLMGTVVLILTLWVLSKYLLKGDVTVRYIICIVIMAFSLSIINFIASAEFLSVLIMLLIGWKTKNRLTTYLLPLVIVAVGMLIFNNSSLLFVFSNLGYISHLNLVKEYFAFYSRRAGVSLPLWISVTTIFWQGVFVLSFTGMMAYTLLFKSARHNQRFLSILIGGGLLTAAVLTLGTVYPVQAIFLDSALGIVALSLAFARMDEGLNGKFQPASMSRLRFIHKPTKVKRKIFLYSAIFALTLLIVPNFFSNNAIRNVDTYYPYPSSYHGFLFLDSYMIHPSEVIDTLVSYYPAITSSAEVNTFGILSSPTASILWSNWLLALHEFSNPNQEPIILLFGINSKLAWASLLSIVPNDLHWEAISNNLSSKNIIYASPTLDMYQK